MSVNRSEGTQETSRGSLGDLFIDPQDLARCFTREQIRESGRRPGKSFGNYKDLRNSRYETGVPSVGNCTAKQAAPGRLVHLGDPYRIY